MAGEPKSITYFASPAANHFLSAIVVKKAILFGLTSTDFPYLPPFFVVTSQAAERQEKAGALVKKKARQRNR